MDIWMEAFCRGTEKLSNTKCFTRNWASVVLGDTLIFRCRILNTFSHEKFKVLYIYIYFIYRCLKICLCFGSFWLPVAVKVKMPPHAPQHPCGACSTTSAEGVKAASPGGVTAQAAVRILRNLRLSEQSNSHWHKKTKEGTESSPTAPQSGTDTESRDKVKQVVYCVGSDLMNPFHNLKKYLMCEQGPRMSGQA